MNPIVKWWKLKRGRTLCHYCPDTWLEDFVTNGNCRNCPKCHTTYVYAWKPRSRWIKKWKSGHGSVGDSKFLLYIQLYFYRTKDGVRKECLVSLNVVDKKTSIILDFGKWSFSNPTLVLPYLMENLTPFNVADKIKKLMLFL